MSVETQENWTSILAFQIASGPTLTSSSSLFLLIKGSSKKYSTLFPLPMTRHILSILLGCLSGILASG